MSSHSSRDKNNYRLEDDDRKESTTLLQDPYNEAPKYFNILTKPYDNHFNFYKYITF